MKKTRIIETVQRYKNISCKQINNCVCFLHQIHPCSLACAIMAGIFVLVSETNLSLDCICVVYHLALTTLINKILQELIENWGKSRFYKHDDSESQS